MLFFSVLFSLSLSPNVLTTQGSFQSLHGAAAGDYQNLLHFQNGNNSQLQASNTASNSSPSTQQQQQYYQQQQHASNIVHQQQPYRQHLNSVTSSDSLSGGNTRSRVNSDSNNSKYNNNNSSNSAKNNGKSNNNNPPLSSDKKCANGANQNSSVNSNRNLSNNNVNSSSNNLSNNSNNSNNNHLRQRHIIELNRQVSELNSKNIEFNRQLSAPVENQNSCNSVYNLYSNHILNNQYSGSPNTNSLNRTKKKRSFKLNGRWVGFGFGFHFKFTSIPFVIPFPTRLKLYAIHLFIPQFLRPFNLRINGTFYCWKLYAEKSDQVRANIKSSTLLLA